jgi:hypothetical protein
VDSINDGDAERGMHADFAGHDGEGSTLINYGIPFSTVDSDAAKGQAFPPGPTQFFQYPTESDRLAGARG